MYGKWSFYACFVLRSDNKFKSKLGIEIKWKVPIEIEIKIEIEMEMNMEMEMEIEMISSNKEQISNEMETYETNIMNT